jgi:hypothetical protein
MNPLNFIFLITYLLFSIANASPCPFGRLAEAGLLDEAQTAKFFAARAHGSETCEDTPRNLEEREHVEQEESDKRQLGTLLGELTGGLVGNLDPCGLLGLLGGGVLGGGLCGGVLQALTGVLASVDSKEADAL